MRVIINLTFKVLQAKENRSIGQLWKLNATMFRVHTIRENLEMLRKFENQFICSPKAVKKWNVQSLKVECCLSTFAPEFSVLYVV